MIGIVTKLIKHIAQSHSSLLSACTHELFFSPGLYQIVLFNNYLNSLIE